MKYFRENSHEIELLNCRIKAENERLKSSLPFAVVGANTLIQVQIVLFIFVSITFCIPLFVFFLYIHTYLGGNMNIFRFRFGREHIYLIHRLG